MENYRYYGPWNADDANEASFVKDANEYKVLTLFSCFRGQIFEALIRHAN